MNKPSTLLFVALEIIFVAAVVSHISASVTYKQTNNILAASNLIDGYTVPCTSDFKATAVCLKLTQIECRAVVYDSEAALCHIFSYSLMDMLNISAEATNLTYYERSCHDKQADQMREGCGCRELSGQLSGYPDCQAYYEEGLTADGVYVLHLNETVVNVWCDFDEFNGWTVIQRRMDGSQDFDLMWSDYELGFGVIENEHWLGNDNIHLLTMSNRRLHIRLVYGDSNEVTAEYDTFYIDDESGNYRAKIMSSLQSSTTANGYTGDFGDSLGHMIDGTEFSARDRDNDLLVGSCAALYTGGWWYNACHYANLNGLWGLSTGPSGITWYSWKMSYDEQFKTSLMKVTCD